MTLGLLHQLLLRCWELLELLARTVVPPQRLVNELCRSAYNDSMMKSRRLSGGCIQQKSAHLVNLLFSCIRRRLEAGRFVGSKEATFQTICLASNLLVRFQDPPFGICFLQEVGLALQKVEYTQQKLLDIALVPHKQIP